MRLRVSGDDTGHEYTLAPIVRGAGDAGVGHDDALAALAAALVAFDARGVATARDDLVAALGAAAAADAVAVIAAFNAYPRMADATGIPLEAGKREASAELRASLGLDRLRQD